MSSPNTHATVQPIDDSDPPAFITAEDQGNHPVSSPERLPITGDTPNPTTTKQRCDGDPMDWESWPTGRPGPLVSEAAMQVAMNQFHFFDSKRNESSRTEEKVFHVTEFSSTGRKIFVGHVTEPELATRLEKPHSETCFRLLFATSNRNEGAIFSTYARRVLSACGAPAAVWATLQQGATSPFYSFTDSRDGNTVFHGWIALRVQWRPFRPAMDLISEPYLSDLKSTMSLTSSSLFPRLYFSYNARTQQTTIMTTDMNQMYLRMVRYLEALPEMANQLECQEQLVQLLVQYFSEVRENIRATALTMDSMATGGERALRMTDNHSHSCRVQDAESAARIVDYTRSDFAAFQAALTSLEKYLQDLWNTLNLRPTFNESFGPQFTEQKQLCEATHYLLDGLVSRYDRYLNLLLNSTNIRMVEAMKNVSEQNAEATKRMAELAEVGQRQAVQGARQTQSMAALAYDAKRDSEVMKAITVVTIIFLPATFLSTIFSMGFFDYDQDQLKVSPQGWIYLACTFPLTFVVLGASFGWIWWTGKKEEKLVDYPAGQALAQVADTLRLGAGPRKEAV